MLRRSFVLGVLAMNWLLVSQSVDTRAESDCEDDPGNGCNNTEPEPNRGSSGAEDGDEDEGDQSFEQGDDEDEGSGDDPTDSADL